MGLGALKVYAGGVRLVILLLGCAGPFAATRPEASRAEGVSISFCGSSQITAEKVLRTLEPPSDLPPDLIQDIRRIPTLYQRP